MTTIPVQQQHRTAEMAFLEAIDDSGTREEALHFARGRECARCWEPIEGLAGVTDYGLVCRPCLEAPVWCDWCHTAYAQDWLHPEGCQWCAWCSEHRHLDITT